jgi:transcriptional regulator with XRE-family HTH domain
MTMTAPPVGELLRDWRQRRRMSQLDLSVEASVSARHLSFVETGRSKPSRELVLHLAEHLDVPLRERNRLLLAAGYAPAYDARPLDDARMSPVRAALDKILTSHQPYPAVIVDRGWDLVAANDAALAVLTEDVAPQLLAGPVNALRVSLHPDGMAPRIANFAEWSAHLMTRLHRQATASGDPALFGLHEELRGYPGVVDEASRPHDVASLLFVPLVLRWRGDELRFFSTLATFGTALDVTIAELAIESFFPADEATAGTMRG